MLAHPQRLCPEVGSHPPGQYRHQQKERRDQEIPALRHRRNAQAPFRGRRIQRQPEQIPQEHRRVEARLMPEPAAHHQEPHGPCEQRDGAHGAQIDRPQLRIAEPARQGRERRPSRPVRQIHPLDHPHFWGAADLHLIEDVLILSHLRLPQCQPTTAAAATSPTTRPTGRTRWCRKSRCRPRSRTRRSAPEASPGGGCPRCRPNSR
jgi:hypothetical protein